MTEFGTEGGVLSTLPNNQYGFMEGTSMACPHVSGVAALVISKFGGKEFTAQKLKDILLNSSNRYSFVHENKFGKGLLNAANAVSDDKNIAPVAVNDLKATDISYNEIKLEWTVPVDLDNGEPRFFNVSISNNEITDQNFDNKISYTFENELIAGKTFSTVIKDLQKLTEYWIAVKSTDRFGNRSEISNIIHVSTCNLPHFMESTKSISLTADLSQQGIYKVPIEFSNIGDGIVSYYTSIYNEDYFWQKVEDNQNTLSTQLLVKAKTAQTNPELFNNTRAISKPVTSLKSGSSVPAELDHWKNDATEFVAGFRKFQCRINFCYPV